jgi:hypothetical protein
VVEWFPGHLICTSIGLDDIARALYQPDPKKFLAKLSIDGGGDEDYSEASLSHSSFCSAAFRGCLDRSKDRNNVSFAALTMNKELGITSQQFGLNIWHRWVSPSLR